MFNENTKILLGYFSDLELIDIKPELPELRQSIFSCIRIAEFENPMENSIAFVC